MIELRERAERMAAMRRELEAVRLRVRRDPHPLIADDRGGR